MKRYYVIEDRDAGEREWSQVSTFDTHQDALDRLRWEAASAPHELIFLNNARLKTLSGYEMRIDTIEVSA